MGGSLAKARCAARDADPGTRPGPLSRRPAYLLTSFAGCAKTTSAPTTRQPDSM